MTKRIRLAVFLILAGTIMLVAACAPKNCPRGGPAPVGIAAGSQAAPGTPSTPDKPVTINVGFWGAMAMTVAAYAVKPAYVIGALLIVVILWGKKSRDLAFVRWALLLFFVGENICSLNYMCTGGVSDTLEFLHGAGMIGMNILLPWGLLLLFDERVFHYLAPDKPCTFQRLCRQCWKSQEVSCGFHQVGVYLVLALATCMLMPLCATMRPFTSILTVFGVDVLWVNSPTILLIEMRLYPIVAALAYIMAFRFLRQGKAGVQRALLPLFIGTGFGSYALFRFVLALAFYDNPAWADWWEEYTEFLAVAAVLLFLFVFRRQLELHIPFLREPAPVPPTETP